MSELQAADTVRTLANELASRGEKDAAIWLVTQADLLDRARSQLAEALRERDEAREERIRHEHAWGRRESELQRQLGVAVEALESITALKPHHISDTISRRALAAIRGTEGK